MTQDEAAAWSLAARQGRLTYNDEGHWYSRYPPMTNYSGVYEGWFQDPPSQLERRAGQYMRRVRRLENAQKHRSS